jgi:hypothetical protein
MKILKQNQKGQALMEYVIVSGLVGIMCLIAVKQFGEAINTRIKNMKSQITEHIQIEKN